MTKAMVNVLNLTKSIISVSLLVFSTVLIVALIFERGTSLSQDVHPVVAFIVLWAALLWLGMVEGGQASMVGLPPVNRSLYYESHPITYQICELGHRGDNLDRYLMGRQFLVLLLVFVINIAGAPLEESASALNMPPIVSSIFLQSGLGMILLTCMVGQLNPQVNASQCMLDFINTHFMTITLYVALTVEASGVLHASYLIQLVALKAAGKDLESSEPDRDIFQQIMFWGRITFSCLLLLFSFTITLAALIEGKTTMWEGVPVIISVVMLFFFMCVVGMLEGMQICFYSVAKLTEEERNTGFWASKTCKLLFKGEGRNLPGFMIGRQLAVVACFFFIARITTTKLEEGESNILANNKFGIPISDPMQTFFDTGLLGALITTIVASIAWQLVASAFPMAYMSNPATYFLLKLCLLLEGTGVCNGAWVLGHLHRYAAGFQRDEIYIGTAKERADLEKADKPKHMSDAGHLTGGAFPAGTKTAANFVPEDWDYVINCW